VLFTGINIPHMSIHTSAQIRRDYMGGIYWFDDLKMLTDRGHVLQEVDGDGILILSGMGQSTVDPSLQVQLLPGKY